MTENQIRKKFKELCGEKGWLCWFPIKSRWGMEKDLFGIWDCLIIRNNQLVPVQLTTYYNRKAREKKIREFYKENKVDIFCEIWSWKKKDKKFNIIRIY